MPYKVRPIYASAAPGKKPTSFKVEGPDGYSDTFLHKVDAEKAREKLNKEWRDKHKGVKLI